jgi:glycosyltransferase involved in cell wall biosynthesis
VSGSPLDGVRTALVHDWLTGMRGGENVLEALAALFPSAPIHTLFHFPGSVSPALEAHEIRTSFVQRMPWIERKYRWYLPLFPTAIEDFDLGEVDLVVSSSHCVAKGVIPPPGAFHLCYCHTPMRYAWDQEHAYFPKRRGVIPRLRAAALSRLRTWDAASATRVDLFVANSRFVAERIRRYYGRDAEVVHPPVDVEFFRPASAEPMGHERGESGLGAPYALAVSALAPYKRMDLAIAACARLGLELRIVGTGPEEDQLRALAALSSTPVRFLGRVPPETLRDLYRGALCFVQPGIEDFGIAAAEAQACGTPVVAAGRGGVLDIVVDQETGILTPPWGSSVDFAEAIDKARQIRFNPLKIRGQAEPFSVAHFAERLRTLLERGISR